MIKLSYIYNPHMFKMMENHPLKEKHDVSERVYFSFKRFEVFHFFIRSGTLLYSLIPTHTTLFLKRTVLQNCTC